jgi:hypothetical protein
MMTRLSRAAAVCGMFLLSGVLAAPAQAARVGVLSNRDFTQVASDFGTKIAGHTFTGVDVGTATPSLPSLQASFDVILLFEDSTFPNSAAVGDVVAAFANSGRPVILGTFYDQDRSDAPLGVTPHGWGALETIDPNTTDGTGTPYAARALDPASVVAHPLTAGVTALTSTSYAGGNQAKPGTVVVANWLQKNARGLADPAIAYRVTGAACVIHVAIAPNYPAIGTYGADFGGDFYPVWKNAADFAAAGCGASPATPVAAGIPTLSEWALVLLSLLLAATAAVPVRRSAAARRGTR